MPTSNFSSALKVCLPQDNLSRHKYTDVKKEEKALIRRIIVGPDNLTATEVRNLM